MLGGTQDLWTSDQGDDVPVVVDPGLDVSGLDAVDQVQSQGGQIDGPHLRVGLFSTRRGNPVLGLSGQCGAVMRADHWTLGSEDYPLTLPLYLFRPARRLPDIARDFLRFVASEEGAIAVDATGFASPYPQNLTLDEQGGRLARALTLIEEDDAFADLRALARDFVGAERLSVGFRFQEGSAELDAPSMANVGILAQYLRDGAARGRAVVFAGFGDGIGSASANRSLSADRAETVRQAVTAALGAAASKFAFESKGFGEGLPLACDADAWGRHANRRVEVWLR
jgi:phosphate transport system substrate-binding protein